MKSHEIPLNHGEIPLNAIKNPMKPGRVFGGEAEEASNISAFARSLIESARGDVGFYSLHGALIQSWEAKTARL